MLMDWKNIVKIQILPELIYRFSKSPIKILAIFFVEINKLVLNFIWKNKGTTIAKTVLKKKDKVAEIILPGIKAHYKDRVNNAFGTGKRLKRSTE